MTVGEMKRGLYRHLHYPPNRLTLVFAGAILKNSDKLTDAGIEDKCAIYVVYSPKRFSTPSSSHFSHLNETTPSTAHLQNESINNHVTCNPNHFQDPTRTPHTFRPLLSSPNDLSPMSHTPNKFTPSRTSRITTSHHETGADGDYYGIVEVQEHYTPMNSSTLNSPVTIQHFRSRQQYERARTNYIQSTHGKPRTSPNPTALDFLSILQARNEGSTAQDILLREDNALRALDLSMEGHQCIVDGMLGDSSSSNENEDSDNNAPQPQIAEWRPAWACDSPQRRPASYFTHHKHDSSPYRIFRGQPDLSDGMIDLRIDWDNDVALGIDTGSILPYPPQPSPYIREMDRRKGGWEKRRRTRVKRGVDEEAERDVQLAKRQDWTRRREIYRKMKEMEIGSEGESEEEEETDTKPKEQDFDDEELSDMSGEASEELNTADAIDCDEYSISSIDDWEDPNDPPFDPNSLPQEPRKHRPLFVPRSIRNTLNSMSSHPPHVPSPPFETNMTSSEDEELSLFLSGLRNTPMSHFNHPHESPHDLEDEDGEDEERDEGEDEAPHDDTIRRTWTEEWMEQLRMQMLLRQHINLASSRHGEPQEESSSEEDRISHGEWVGSRTMEHMPRGMAQWMEERWSSDESDWMDSDLESERDLEERETDGRKIALWEMPLRNPWK
ncbi:hypothetical protein BLNAU_22030 [Blattamonas nauphoetae]|uniref:Ubiquitin-like domain-containing protein n=1 Tax=Blattamonas nauphoetae TaxID=2049346 RepID=A0ABQ9WU70_9EUKA|nr:hypothetical protein BLNAU_22030 [Blattamonas nauphoetae]